MWWASYPLSGNIHQRPAAIAWCLGVRFAASAVLSERVSCMALREFFCGYICKTIEDIDILARAFILCLLGSCPLSNVDNTVHMGFLRALEDLDQTAHYDWGGAALATLYGFIGGVAHGMITCTEGFYHIWEVCETVLFIPFFPFSAFGLACKSSLSIDVAL